MAKQKIIISNRCEFQSGSVIDGQYIVKKTLGEGSFGVVYLVTGQDGTQYALKLLRLWEVTSDLRPELVGRFEVEFRTGQIDCPNLVHSLATGNVSGNPYILMEFCPGGDMQPYLGQAGALAPQMCYEILMGLKALHSNGKVHRDLKPENVLFKQGGVAALTDFGIAGDCNHRITQMNIFKKPGQMFGTWAYMPPEQMNRVRGGATVRPTTDIFSFGVLAYQLVTGKLPFGKLDSHNDLANYTSKSSKGKWDRQTLQLSPDGQRWERLIEGCLVADYQKRLQTVDQVVAMLPQPQQPFRQLQPQPQPKPNPQLQQVQQPYRMSAQYRPNSITRGFALRVMQGEENGRVYDLSELVRKQHRRIITVGRNPQNSVYIRSDFSDYISRFHCTIMANETGGQWMVQDGQWRGAEDGWKLSKNGTYVNSSSVSQKGYYLKPGDIIAMGDITVRFENY